MPFPVIVGVPWLAGIIGALFSSIFAFVLQFVTKRLAVVLAGIAIITAVTAAFLAAIYALLQGISYVTPPEIVQAFSIVVPSNFSLCAAAIASAHLLRWVYFWQLNITMIKLRSV